MMRRQHPLARALATASCHSAHRGRKDGKQERTVRWSWVLGDWVE